MNERTVRKVVTTIGDLYVRRMVARDLAIFEKLIDKSINKDATDLSAVGEKALRVLVSPKADSETLSGLSDEAYKQLKPEDIDSLAYEMARVYEVELLPSKDILQALGSVLFDRLAPTLRRISEQAERMRVRFGRNFGSLSPALQSSIGENVRQINSITEGLRNSSAMSAFRRAQETRINMLDGTALGTLLEQNRIGSLVDQMKVPITRTQELEEHEYSPATPIDFSKTPIARAAAASEDAAQQLQEVAGLTAQMAEKIGTLHTTFLTEVIPEWKSSLHENTANANRSLRHAVWALGASIFVAILLTCIQMWIGHGYKLENDVQQSATEHVLRKQLETLESMNQRLADESTMLREELFKLNKEQAVGLASKYFLYPHVP